MRKELLTLCDRGADIVITHIMRGNHLEISCEQARNDGFNTLILLDDGTVVSNDGFNEAEKDFLIRFCMQGVARMLEQQMEDN